VLPLPFFEWHAARSVTEALAMLERWGTDAVLVAGGTDLYPNMKRGLTSPRHVISLREIAGLAGIRQEAGYVHVGATSTLLAIAESPLVRLHAAALAEAAAAVGGPQHRAMGTIGGNLCLDTRCRYYDQTYFWRSALGFCLKKDGSVCHVVAGGKRCVAAASNDTATAAIALGASVELASPRGSRSVLAKDFYTANGIANTVREADEIVVALRVPIAPGGASAYEKLRRRGAIDFPLLSVAAAATVTEGVVASLEVVVSALAARPRVVSVARALALGRALAEIPRAEIASGARKECAPLPNIEGDAGWRREMVPVLVERALARLALGGGLDA
jgi:4-hydroxybenzoyl-CoA reductase subunit beta